MAAGLLNPASMVNQKLDHMESRKIPSSVIPL